MSGAMFFDSSSGNAFGWYETANEAIEEARIHVDEWAPFVLMIYGPDGRIERSLTDEDLDAGSER